MKSAKHIWEEITYQLKAIYDSREAQNMAYLLLEDLLCVDRTAILIGDPIKIDEQILDTSLSRLLKGEPVQYVTGVADFYGRKFKIEPGTLIPRPETEELVALILEQNTQKSPKIADVGIGSGCIAITLALEMGTHTFGLDVSQKAISIAEENARSLGASLEVLHHDILQKKLPVHNLDILVSNPPYIPLKDRKTMDRNVTDFEPELALFVPDDDPLIFYRRIAEEGRSSLVLGGQLFFEIHEAYGPPIQSLLEDLGYKKVVIHQDMQKKDRMVSAINGANKLP